MKLRKTIGWLLFALGIPFSFVIVAVSKEMNAAIYARVSNEQEDRERLRR